MKKSPLFSTDLVIIFELTRPPAQVVGLQVPVPVLLAYQSVVAVVAVAWRRHQGSAFHRHIDHLGHSQHHIHCAHFGLDHILLASWQPAHHNQDIQLLRPEETSEIWGLLPPSKKKRIFQKKNRFGEVVLSKTYRTKTGIRAENHFSINHSSESDYRMSPVTCRSLSFTCPVNRTTSSAPAGSFWLAPGRPAENYVDRTMCSWGSLIQIEVPSNIKASLSASACLWHPKNPDPSWLNRIGGRTIPSLG